MENGNGSCNGSLPAYEQHFPHYELYLIETGQIAAPDHFYIFSLLLFFSCVRHSERFFQQICNGFDKPQQYAVTAFLKWMLESAQMRQEIDRMMIRRSIQDAMPQTMLPPETPPNPNPAPLQRESSRLSLPSRLTSSTVSSGDIVDGSPLRLGRQPPKISPPTPKTIILDERTKQLKELKAQLEAERYEKGYLEYVKEIRELRTELQACNRENESPNKQRGVDYKVARIERLLAEKEEALDRLRIELETVAENNRNSTEMINYRNVQIVKLKDQIQELENSLGSLSECIAEKDEVIKCLRENNEELQRFIEESRFKQNGPLPENLNTSFDGMMELSSGGSSNGNGTGRSYNITPENMAHAVVDVQLKEKEAENCLLKRSLEIIEQEKVRVSGLVGSFFRLYGDLVGAMPYGSTNPQDVGFVEKMNIFKSCYESLFEELGKFKESKEMLEEKSDALEKDVRALKTELLARTEVLENLERHSADIERQLELVKQTANEYQRKNQVLDEDVNRQKRDLLKLISEKDSLSQQNLTLNVEFKIDYLMLSLNEDYEGSDFSSWSDKMDDLKERVRTLKEDKERLTGMNMKITMEKVGLEKHISVSEIRLEGPKMYMKINTLN
ncbi:AAEL002942-PA [Aedes aegypti]|uniref:AAEL002942-PA n=1 Tax=Aedes aegypti TaxID=7159 RepID=Q17GQ4_AEDAE|nr:AAEL002942-PA [Aedes aegypti]